MAVLFILGSRIRTDDARSIFRFVYPGQWIGTDDVESIFALFILGSGYELTVREPILAHP